MLNERDLRHMEICADFTIIPTGLFCLWLLSSMRDVASARDKPAMGMPARWTGIPVKTWYTVQEPSISIRRPYC